MKVTFQWWSWTVAAEEPEPKKKRRRKKRSKVKSEKIPKAKPLAKIEEFGKCFCVKDYQCSKCEEKRGKR